MAKLTANRSRGKGTTALGITSLDPTLLTGRESVSARSGPSATTRRSSGPPMTISSGRLDAKRRESVRRQRPRRWNESGVMCNARESVRRQKRCAMQVPKNGLASGCRVYRMFSSLRNCDTADLFYGRKARELCANISDLSSCAWPSALGRNAAGDAHLTVGGHIRTARTVSVRSPPVRPRSECRR